MTKRSQSQTESALVTLARTSASSGVPDISASIHWNWETVVFGILLIALLLPIWTFRFFPTQDGPAHTYNAVVLRNYLNADEARIRQYYLINPELFPNWLTSAIIVGLTYIFSFFTAEKLIISLYILSLPLSIRYALAGLHKDAVWLSSLSLPFVYNDFLHRGFYNFLLSIALFFFIVGYWWRRRYFARATQMLALGLLASLAFFTHIVGFGVLTITLPILIASEVWRENKSFIRPVSSIWLWLIALGPSLFLAARWFLARPSSLSYPAFSWKTIIWWLYGLLATANTFPHLAASMSVGLLWASVFFFSWFRRSRAEGILFVDGLFSSGVLLFVLYFVVPEGSSGGYLLKERLIFFSMLLLILFFGTVSFDRRVRLLIGSSVAMLTVVTIVLNMHIYAQVNREAADYFSSAEVVEPYSTILSICLANEGCDTRRGYLRISPWESFYEYLAAQKHLVSLSNLHAHEDYFPIRYRPSIDPFPYLENSSSHGQRIWAPTLPVYSQRTGGNINYVILWGLPDAILRNENTSPLEDWLLANYDLVMDRSAKKLLVYREKIKPR